MKRKYLLLLLVVLAMALGGCPCDKKKHVAPPPAPSAPSNLSGSAVSSTEINLTWKDNSTNEKGFYVYRRTTDNYSRVAIMEANATSYSDSDLNPETSYWYKVRAYNDGGDSGSSNEVNITTPPGLLPPLEAPTDLSANTVSYKQINLSWRDNSDTEDGFRVRCNIGHTQTNTIATVGRNTTKYEHCKLQPMTDHKYYIEAFRGEEAAGSPQVSATTPCPVTTFVWEAWFYEEYGDRSDTLVMVTLQIKSEASEPCRVEVFVFVHDWYVWEEEHGELMGSTEETFELEAFEWDLYEVEVLVSRAPGIPNKIYGGAEITDVEILY